MKTISALCATSTVGVAAVGYCFGTDTPQSNKRKSSVEDRDQFLSTRPRPRPRSNTELSSGRAATYLRSRTAPSSHSPITPNFAQRKRRLSRSGPDFSWDLRDSFADVDTSQKLSSPRAKQPNGNTLGSVSSQSSKRSWIQRLSSQTASQKSSPLSTPLYHTPPDTPSRVSSFTKLSAKDSRPQDAQPNKLVKRSASQIIRQNSSAGYTITSGTYRPTLRRPATSHQRSATLQQQYQLDADTPLSGHVWSSNEKELQPLETLNRTKYYQYFQQISTTLLELDSPVAGSGNRRTTLPIIVPSSIDGPTLLKADCTTVADIQSTRLSQYRMDEQQNQFSGVELQAGSSPASAYNQPSSQPAGKDHTPERQPRRSFSIGDLLSPSSPTWLSWSGNKDGTSIQAQPFVSNRRRASAPFNILSKRVSVSAHAGSPKSRTNNRSRAFLEDRESFSRRGNLGSSSPIENQSSGARSISSSLPPIDPLSSLNLGLFLQPEDRSSYALHIQSAELAPQTSPASLPPSGKQSQSRSRSVRLSLVASSERASTLIESDCDHRGFTSGEDDQMSETVFDSLRTGATNSSLGYRGPRADRIFDDSPTGDDKQHLIKSLQRLTVDNGSDDNAASAFEDTEESITTPRQRERPSLSNSETIAASGEMGAANESIEQLSSFRETKRNVINTELETYGTDASRFENWEADDDNDDEDDDDEDDENWDRDAAFDFPSKLSSPHLGRSPQPPLHRTQKSENEDHNSHEDHLHAKASLFDWAEQVPADRFSLGNQRPRTVHGKRGINRSGGRPLARVNASHIRSQSVPVAPEVNPTRETTKVTNRFGTWGIGSARVKEDWDSDFVFDGPADDKEFDQVIENDQSGQLKSMIVPQSIKESQANVIGNLGYIKEFALLVDDLKKLKSLALSRDITDGQSAELWKEADAMIELATVDDSCEPFPKDLPIPIGHRDYPGDDWAAEALTNRGRRKSVLSLEDDIFGGFAESRTQASPDHRTKHAERDSFPTSRDTKNADMSSIAISVIESIQQRRAAGRTSRKADGSVPERLPFDTATLKNLVAHVNTLVRKLADILREED